MTAIKISNRELEQLKRDQRKLQALVQALEAGGIDNWEWYSESLKDFYQEERFDDLVGEFCDSILLVCSEEGDVGYPAGRECGHRILLDDAEDTVRELLRKFYIEASKDDAD